jgi:hypothetical protein
VSLFSASAKSTSVASDFVDLEIGMSRPEPLELEKTATKTTEQGVKQSSGAHSSAMKRSDSSSDEETQSVPLYRETPRYGEPSARTSVSSREGYVDLESQDYQLGEAELPRDGSTPPEMQGPGGCCRGYDSACQMLKAGVVQMLSTAVTFGTKPIVEAAVMSAFGVTSIAAAPLVASITTAVVGGLYVGVVHTTASRIVSGLMNSALSVNTYSPKPDSQALLGEIGTIDVPVMGAFIGGYAVRGMVMEGSTDIWMDALSKTVTSTSAGFLQGVVTDALRQTMVAYEKVYSEKAPTTIPSGEKLKFITETFDKTLNYKVMSGKEIGHDVVGKSFGSTFGMLYTLLVKELGLGAMAGGATSMTAYLTSWFTGIHVGSAVLDSISPSSSSSAPLLSSTPTFSDGEIV